MGQDELESVEEAGATKGCTVALGGAELESSPRQDRSRPARQVPVPAVGNAGPTTCDPERPMGAGRFEGLMTQAGGPDAVHPEGPRIWETTRVSPQRFEPGEIVFGRYVVLEKLGEGGMGSVWLVRHQNLNVDRALKIILSGLAFDPQIRGRFKREAQVMARFFHPNAVTVHDAQLTDDAAFIEMELVHGRSLDKLLTKGVPVPLDLTGRILAQLCDVLDVADEQKIVHRDLKPSNLMLVDGLPPGALHLKVLDFGIAKILEAEEADGDVRTLPGTFIGTPPYTSPEQAEGYADARSDIYSVGVILYELLTGHRPFVGKRMRLISDTLNLPPPPFAAVNPAVDVPPAVERLVLRCLAKDPAQRPQTPRELAEEFHRAIAPPAEEPAPPPTVPAPRPRYRTAATFALLICLLVAVAVFVRMRRPPPVSVPEDYEAIPGPLSPGGQPLHIAHRDDGTRFHLIEGTKDFLMGGIDGAPPPALPSVAIPSFYMQETEVTNGEMERFLAGNPNLIRPRAWQEAYDQAKEHGLALAESHPAVGISHELADRYARSMHGHLPTEAQWEYAARSGGRVDRPFVWGPAPAPQRGERRANIDRNDAAEPGTSPVLSYPTDRTEQGVYDLTGNAREWCLDEAEPRGSGAYVVRGGSWATYADRFSTTARETLAGDEMLPDVGFRVVIEATPPPGIVPGR